MKNTLFLSLLLCLWVLSVQALLAQEKHNFNNGKPDVAHLVINVMDKNRTSVYAAENEITMTVEGPATEIVAK